ncbi:crustacyanin-C1 subunit-like [Panulirus ornatus]|uniref:crustacyanin-C1 subunit-like n=1 Tax=Panulirus ornatus TaxID=150431 RepID=UPI003A8ADC80
MKQLSYLLCLVAAVAANKIPDFVVPGKCPSVDKGKLWSEQTPNHEKYEGVWYQYAVIKNPYHPIDKCVRIEYSFDGRQFEAVSTGITADDRLIKHSGNVYPNPFGEPHLTIDYDNTFAAPYVILDTDYDNYACIHSCIDFNFGYHSDFAFIFSRSPSLSDSHVKRCEDAFKNINFDTSRFVKTYQGSSCPYDSQREL